jgi:hypothetical protein
MPPENLDVAVARLDERVKGHDSLIDQVAKDLKRIATAYEELVKSNQRISLVEQELLNQKESQKILWEKFDANEKAQKKVAADIVYDIIKLGVAVSVGFMLHKLGIQLP